VTTHRLHRPRLAIVRRPLAVIRGWFPRSSPPTAAPVSHAAGTRTDLRPVGDLLARHRAAEEKRRLEELNAAAAAADAAAANDDTGPLFLDDLSVLAARIDQLPLLSHLNPDQLAAELRDHNQDPAPSTIADPRGHFVVVEFVGHRPGFPGRIRIQRSGGDQP
jgi:hypothetical protein